MFTFDRRERREAKNKVQLNVTFQVYITASCFLTNTHICWCTLGRDLPAVSFCENYSRWLHLRENWTKLGPTTTSSNCTCIKLENCAKPRQSIWDKSAILLWCQGSSSMAIWAKTKVTRNVILIHLRKFSHRASRLEKSLPTKVMRRAYHQLLKDFLSPETIHLQFSWGKFLFCSCDYFLMFCINHT